MTNISALCATEKWIFALSGSSKDTKIVRIPRYSEKLSEGECFLEILLFAGQLSSGWQTVEKPAEILSAEHLGEDLEFANFGVFSISESSLKTGLGELDQNQTVLIAATETEAFLASNGNGLISDDVEQEEKESAIRLYRIHDDKNVKSSVQIIQHNIPESQNKLVQIACGKAHTLLLEPIIPDKDRKGAVFSFGNGSRGELGHGTVASDQFPAVVEGTEGLKIVKIAVGGWHSAALSDIGDVYLWGWNESGQLGVPVQSVSTALDPIVLDIPGQSVSEKDVKAMACGSRFTVVLLADGQCFICGRQPHLDNSERPNEELHLLRKISNERISAVCAYGWSVVIQIESK